jgi:hypothetical protein
LYNIIYFNKIFFSIAQCSVGCQFLDKKKNY